MKKIYIALEIEEIDIFDNVMQTYSTNKGTKDDDADAKQIILDDGWLFDDEEEPIE